MPILSMSFFLHRISSNMCIIEGGLARKLPSYERMVMARLHIIRSTTEVATIVGLRWASFAFCTFKKQIVVRVRERMNLQVKPWKCVNHFLHRYGGPRCCQGRVCGPPFGPRFGKVVGKVHGTKIGMIRFEQRARECSESSSRQQNC